MKIFVWLDKLSVFCAWIFANFINHEWIKWDGWNPARQVHAIKLGAQGLWFFGSDAIEKSSLIALTKRSQIHDYQLIRALPSEWREFFFYRREEWVLIWMKSWYWTIIFQFLININSILSSSYQCQFLSTQLWNALINFNVNFNCAKFSLSIVSYQLVGHLWWEQGASWHLGK